MKGLVKVGTALATFLVGMTLVLVSSASAAPEVTMATIGNPDVAEKVMLAAASSEERRFVRDFDRPFFVRDIDRPFVRFEQPFVRPFARPFVRPFAVNPFAVNPFAVNPFLVSPFAISPFAINPFVFDPFDVDELFEVNELFELNDD